VGGAGQRVDRGAVDVRVLIEGVARVVELHDVPGALQDAPQPLVPRRRRGQSLGRGVVGFVGLGLGLG
jgi:hypothetical protein